MFRGTDPELESHEMTSYCVLIAVHCSHIWKVLDHVEIGFFTAGQLRAVNVLCRGRGYDS